MFVFIFMYKCVLRTKRGGQYKRIESELAADTVAKERRQVYVQFILLCMINAPHMSDTQQNQRKHLHIHRRIRWADGHWPSHAIALECTPESIFLRISSIGLIAGDDHWQTSRAVLLIVHACVSHACAWLHHAGKNNLDKHYTLCARCFGPRTRPTAASMSIGN